MKLHGEVSSTKLTGWRSCLLEKEWAHDTDDLAPSLPRGSYLKNELTPYCNQYRRDARTRVVFDQAVEKLMCAQLIRTPLHKGEELEMPSICTWEVETLESDGGLEHQSELQKGSCSLDSRPLRQ